MTHMEEDLEILKGWNKMNVEFKYMKKNKYICLRLKYSNLKNDLSENWIYDFFYSYFWF